MAPAWASQTLKDWCASACCPALTPAEEIACAKRIEIGVAARNSLLETYSPSVLEFLSRSALFGEIVRESRQAGLARAIVDFALDTWATSGRPADQFPDIVLLGFPDLVRSHAENRRQTETDYWFNEDAWLAESFDPVGLRASVHSVGAVEPIWWSQLADAGAAVNDLVAHGVRVIPRVIANIQPDGFAHLSREDAESEAALALRPVAWKFSGSKGAGFLQLAFPSLKNAITSKMRTAHGRTEDSAKKIARYRQVKAELWLRLGRRPTIDDVLAAIHDWGDRAKENFRRLWETTDIVPADWTGAVEALPSDSNEPLIELISHEDATALEERLRLIDDSLETMDRDERSALVSLYILGVPKADFARRARLSLAEVDKLKERALKNLRALCIRPGHDG